MVVVPPVGPEVPPCAGDAGVDADICRRLEVPVFAASLVARWYSARRAAACLTASERKKREDRIVAV